MNTKAIAIISLLAFATSGCATMGELPIASDSFCSTYQRLIQAKGEGAIAALRPVKNRIAANEKTYLCLCVDPQHKVCKAPEASAAMVQR